MESLEFTGDVPEFYTHTRHIYAFRHALNTVEIFLPKIRVESPKHWIVWIHGGAWRDPSLDAMSVVPALHFLDPHKYGIPGVASINYGLSPYPSHRTNPSSPDDPSRNNVHPCHVEDVVSALQWLEQRFNYGRRYVLAGHSCGATLAFQVMSGSARNFGTLVKDTPRAPYPEVIVGMHGIYDLQLLVKDFGSEPIYRTFTEAAFGKDEAQWRLASPVGWPYDVLWTEGKLCVLAHGDDDGIVNWAQTEAMKKHLDHRSLPTREHVVIKTVGKHDDIWRRGTEVARVLVEALKLVQTTPQMTAELV